MPLYEYQCESCGARFEVIQKFSDRSVDTCRTCGGKVQRLLSAPAIQFKGTGWYVTDYARKGTSGSESEKAEKAEKTEKTSSSSESSSTTSDKPAATTDTKSASPAPSTPSPSSSAATTSGDNK